MKQEDLLKLGASFLAGSVTAFVALKVVIPKLSGCSASEGRFNTAHELDKAKVVNSYDIEDLGDKVAFCRCWKSKKFPYCDGTHNAHNKLTGDNLGPVCLSRKESTA
ncbi:CDGSH iron-sulfur domain-containing protein 2 homolog [Clytia hemisphaerica]|uniref:CDGSH iron-sulfur domain-containing protein 2 homolog n=1 Tax=Clytia hemisphaerica TaxID=252671 RepID=UPI0034D62DDE|eukprot:TCONS_00055442-protein